MLEETKVVLGAATETAGTFDVSRQAAILEGPTRLLVEVVAVAQPRTLDAEERHPVEAVAPRRAHPVVGKGDAQDGRTTVAKATAMATDLHLHVVNDAVEVDRPVLRPRLAVLVVDRPATRQARPDVIGVGRLVETPGRVARHTKTGPVAPS